MGLTSSLLAGSIAAAVLTVIIKYTYLLELNPKSWDVLENGVAPLLHLTKTQVYIMHILTEVIVFPLMFSLFWTKTLGTNLSSPILSALFFAFSIFALASIVPLLKAPQGYRLKATLGLLLGRLAYGLSLGITISLLS